MNDDIFKGIIEQLKDKGRKILEFKEKLSEPQLNQLCEVLKDNKSLVALSIQGPIGDKGAEKIAEVLKINTTLSTLLLQKTQIYDEGAAHIILAMKQNKTLKELGLVHNKITDVGAGLFANLIKENQLITQLTLCENLITKNGIGQIARACLHSTSLNLIDLRGNIRGNINKSSEFIDSIDEMLKDKPIDFMIDYRRSQASKNLEFILCMAGLITPFVVGYEVGRKIAKAKNAFIYHTKNPHLLHQVASEFKPKEGKEEVTDPVESSLQGKEEVGGKEEIGESDNLIQFDAKQEDQLFTTALNRPGN